MPYTVDCSPAPLTFSVRPKVDWLSVLSIAWVCFVAYEAFANWRKIGSYDPFDLTIFVLASLSVVLSFIRHERIEIYPDQMIWRKTYFGFTRSRSAPLSDVLAAEWNEGDQDEMRRKGPDYVEFYLPNGSVKACYGFTFDDFDRMRNEIRGMYPDVVKRWSQSTTHSKTFTLLNLS
ncbi:MAG: hypothetical protein ACM3SW_18640 [Actinomycetota bacterium]